MITSSVSSLSYNKVTVGQFVTKQFNVFNDTPTPANIQIISGDPTFSATFSNPVPANNKVVVTVKFEPAAVQNYTNILTVKDLTTGSPDSIIHLTGEGVKPTISVTPSIADFGNISIQDSKIITFTVQNTSSDAVLLVSNITIPNVDFTKNANTLTIPHGGSSQINVTFSPSIIGLITSQLQITSNASNEPLVSKDLQGVGAIPVASIDTGAIQFGDVPINETKTGTAILTNISPIECNLLITQITSSNPEFRVNSYNRSIKQNSSSQISVLFNPTTPGAHSGILHITTNDTNIGIIDVSLDGTGILAPNIQIDTTIIDFGKLEINASLTKSFRVSNNGVVELIGFVQGNGDFEISDSSFNINPGESEIIDVIFNPTEYRDYSATLQINSNDPDAPLKQISVIGKVKKPELSTDAGVDFGKTNTNTEILKNLVIRNIGDGKLNIQNVECSDLRFTVLSFPTLITGNGSGQVSLKFNTNDVGVFETILRIHSNDLTFPTKNVTLKAQTLSPDIKIIGTELDFGKVPIQSSKTSQVQIFNNGDANLVISQIATVSPFHVNDTSLTIPTHFNKYLNVSFNPMISDDFQQNLTLTNNDPDSPSYVILLKGEGAASKIEMDTSPMAFGNVAVETGTDKKGYTLTKFIKNTGTADLTLAISTNYSFFTTDVIEKTLAHNESFTLSVTFKPINGNLITGAQLSIQTNDVENLLIQIPLSGTGLLSGVLTTSIGSSPNDVDLIDFGKVIQETKKYFSVLLKNTGTATLTISKITVFGEGFGINQFTTPSEILVGQSKTLSVYFNPTRTYNPDNYKSNGQLSIETDELHSTKIIILEGESYFGKTRWIVAKVNFPSTIKNTILEFTDVIKNYVIAPLEKISDALDILKRFIIGITDPISAILNGINAAIESFKKNISNANIYWLPILPENNEEANISWKKNWQSFATKSLTDQDQLKILFGNDSNQSKSFLNQIKGGYPVFETKIVDSFSDIANEKRPTFKDTDYAAGFILYAGANADFSQIWSLIKKFQDVYQTEKNTIFEPPINIKANSNQDGIRITFSPGNSLLNNSYLIFRSEIKGGEQTDYLTNSGNSRAIYDYDFIGCISTMEQFTNFFKISTDEYKNSIQKTFGYTAGLAKKFYGFEKFQYQFYDKNIDDLRTYYYIICPALIGSENSEYVPKAIEVENKNEGKKFSDFFNKKDQSGMPIARVSTKDSLVFDIGLPSAEVAGGKFSPFALIEAKASGLSRCQNYVCTLLEDGKYERLISELVFNNTTLIGPQINSSQLVLTNSQNIYNRSITINLDLGENKLVESTVVVKIYGSKTSQSIKDQVLFSIWKTAEEGLELSKNEYKISPDGYLAGKSIVIDNALVLQNFVDSYLTIEYQILRKVNTEVINSQWFNDRHNGDTVELLKTIYDKSTTKVQINFHSDIIPLREDEFEIINQLTGLIKLSISTDRNIGQYSFTAQVKYETPKIMTNVFKCVSGNEQYNIHFDEKKCFDGTIRGICGGYQDLHCIYNNGESCTINSQVATEEPLEETISGVYFTKNDSEKTLKTILRLPKFEQWDKSEAKPKTSHFYNPDSLDIIAKIKNRSFNLFQTTDKVKGDYVARDKFYGTIEINSKNLYMEYPNGGTVDFTIKYTYNNTQVSRRKTIKYDPILRKSDLVEENLDFSTFYDSISCQNGRMQGRCDGYLKNNGPLPILHTPKWEKTPLSDLPFFKQILALLNYVQDKVISPLLQSTKELTDTLIEFIDNLQRKIDKLVNDIKTIVYLIESLVLAFDFKMGVLAIPAAKGGNSYLIKSIQEAANKPTSGSEGYAVGFMGVVGGANTDFMSEWKKITTIIPFLNPD